MKNRRGQTMVLTVMLLSGAVLGATAIVGLLMIYEIRNAVDIINSAKALAAADAGIQCALMKRKEVQEFSTSSRNCGETTPISLSSSGARYSVTEVMDDEGVAIGVRSTGTSGRISRSFEAAYGEEE